MSRKFVVGWLLLCLGISTVMTGWFMAGRAQAGSFDLAAAAREDLIRIHVIANSDSREDQGLKLQVRDAVMNVLTPRFHGVTTTAEAEAVIADTLFRLESEAARVIAEQGFTYGVRAELGWFDFPDKSMDGLTLPAGNYKALRVVIGQGQGANFWCLLYPSFCYRVYEVQKKHGGSTGAGKGAGTDDRW